MLLFSKDEELAEVGKFGKNYLPILFNLYTSKAEEKAPELLSVLETIRAYLTLTDQQVCCSYGLISL